MAAVVSASPRIAPMDPPSTSASLRASNTSMPPPSATSNQIKTPLSSTYPNHIHSPLRSSARRDHHIDPTDPIKTPCTPPSAYFDFLRILSPNPYTPSPLSTGTSTRFSHDSNYPSPAWPSSALRDEKNLLRPTISSARSTSSSGSGSSFSSAASEASSSALSAAAGAAAVARDRSSAPPVANSSKPLQRPSELAFGRSYSAPESNSDIATTTITATDPTTGTRTTEITRPHTARPAMQPGTPRLIIPPSPSSSVTQMSPSQHSAPATTANVPHSACPPSAISASGQAQSATMKSAGGWTPASATGRESLWAKAAAQSAGAPPSAHPTSAGAAASPGGWQRGKSPGPTGTSSPVTIKHVVTRTVTYHRRPGVPAVQGPARPGVGAAVARGVAQSPLSAVEAIPEEVEEEKKGRPLVGEVPRRKRRRVE